MSNMWVEGIERCIQYACRQQSGAHLRRRGNIKAVGPNEPHARHIHRSPADRPAWNQCSMWWWWGSGGAALEAVWCSRASGQRSHYIITVYTVCKRNGGAGAPGMFFGGGAVKRFPAAEQTALSRPEVKQHCALMDSVCPDRQLPTLRRLLPHLNTTDGKLYHR